MSSPQGLDRLDPDLVAQATLFRVALSVDSVPAIRQSLNELCRIHFFVLLGSSIQLFYSLQFFPGSHPFLKLLQGKTSEILFFR